MNTEQAIYHRALRCRPGDAEKYKHVHMALAGSVSPAEELAFMEAHYSPIRPTFWQRVKGWFA